MVRQLGDVLGKEWGSDGEGRRLKLAAENFKKVLDIRQRVEDWANQVGVIVSNVFISVDSNIHSPQNQHCYIMSYTIISRLLYRYVRTIKLRVANS